MRRNGLGDCSSDCTYFLVRTSSWKCIAGFAAALALHSSLLRGSFALPEAQPEMLETFMTFMQLESFCKDHVRFIWWDAMQLLRFSRHVGNDMLYVVTSMLWSVSWKDSPEADDKLCGRCTGSFKSLRDCSEPFCSWMCLQSDATLCKTHWLWQQIDHVPPGNSFNIKGTEMHCSNSRFVQAVAWLAEKAGANTSVWKERHGPWFVQKMQCNYKRASKAEADECEANPCHRCDKNTDWMWWSES